MRSTIRVFVSFIAAVATFYFVFWVPFSLILPDGQPRWIAVVGSLLCAALVARFIWRHTAAKVQPRDGRVDSSASPPVDARPAELLRYVLLGALVAGGIGFSAGFFGPILLTPDANQGPLLGIFITGPLGLLLGAAGGFFYWYLRGRASRPERSRSPHV